MFDESFYLDWRLFGDGEFSISEITRQYVSEGKAQIRNIGTTTWIDCGTPESLHDASVMAKRGEISTQRVDV